MTVYDWYLFKCDCGYHFTDYPFLQCVQCGKTTYKSENEMTFIRAGEWFDSVIMQLITEYEPIYFSSLFYLHDCEIAEDDLQKELIDFDQPN